MKPSLMSVGAVLRRLLTILAVAAIWGALPAAGQNPSASGESQKPPASEITSQESPPSFQLRVERNLVLVRVVVRDSKGRAVPNLRKENFQLFDNGKPQTISEFAVEGGPTSGAAKGAAPVPPEERELQPTRPVASRYVALYFDDMHMPFEEIVRARDAADKFLKSTLSPEDRAGIFTSSGQDIVDFTSSLDDLHAALLRLRPHLIEDSSVEKCPDIQPYQAYQIVHETDPTALRAAADDFISCQCGGDVQNCPSPEQHVRGEAMRILNVSEDQARYALRGLEQLVRRMGTLPGQRSVVWVSPGFLSKELEYDLSELVDRALRAGVIINTLDSRGLYAPDMGDITRRPNAALFDPLVAGWLVGHRQEELRQASDVLATLAMGTGGVFFQNSNDFDEGFRRTGGLPATSYVLAFSPANLRHDGRFHALKVRLIDAPGLSVQTRRGYFAPKELQDAKAQADEEMREAAFSRDELRELPVEVHTQFFKLNDREAQLSVLTHLDIRALHFRKEEERNWDDIRLLAVVFDQDGHVVNALEKTLHLSLRDVSLEHLVASGITSKSRFKVPPGTYLVRVVVRDSEGRQLSGLNRTVEIPY
jgi:VWFA-related protein